MSNFSPAIDAYIAKAQPFAQPIMHKLRGLVHQACPEVKELIKWSFPNYEYKGILCSMAAFKEHCSFGFWKASLMSDPNNLLESTERSAMGHLGRITCLEDLPSDDVILAFIQQAIELNEMGVKKPAKPVQKGPRELEVPDYFIEVLNQHPKAKETFDNFSYSHKKEYVEWIMEAKTEPTRQKRMQTTIEWLAEGKGRNWKYENC